MNLQRIADGEQWEAMGPQREPGDTGLESLDDEVLLQQLAGVMESQRFLIESRERFETETQRRMEAKGASALTHDAFEEIVLEEKATYDQARLEALVGLLSDEQIAAVYTPGHEETVLVDPKWNVNRVRGLAKYGNAVATVIEGARVPGKKQLRLKLRKGDHDA